MGAIINWSCLLELYDSLNQYEYSVSSAYTGELTGGPPDLAAGINVDLHLLFDELVGLLNLGTLAGDAFKILRLVCSR